MAKRPAFLQPPWDETLVTFLILGLQDFFLDAKRSVYVFLVSPRRVWDDTGWKTSPGIIPHLGIEGNLRQTWDAPRNPTHATVHLMGYELKICFS